MKKILPLRLVMAKERNLPGKEMIRAQCLGQFWRQHNSKVVLGILLTLFFVYAVFLAFRLETHLIPDEPAHFTFAKHFSTTLGIPPDTYETYSWGWYIEQNPFLYYWVSARIINLIQLAYPTATDPELLVSLRIVSVLYALGTLLFCLFISREVIQHKWWQLLPVFLLINTLMFGFIAAGVHYDNLANLFCSASIFFLIKAFKNRNFVENSLAWMISIALGTLVKYPILPLALGMSISWIVYVIIKRKNIFPIKLNWIKTIILTLILTGLVVGNFAIYGINLIRYQSITPPCREILLDSQCEISKYEKRHQDLALQEKLTVAESIAEGYPSPIRYLVVDWVYHILLRIFGLSGHQAYFPYHLITYYQILFYMIVILGLLNLLLWRSFSGIEINLLGIAAFYAVVLLIRDYDSELVYGFRQVAVQGRYLFPVIPCICVLMTRIIKSTPITMIKYFILAFTIGLISFGGPITILIGYQTTFATWFK